MENASSTNSNRTWVAIALGVIVVCLFLFLSVCVIAFSFVAVRISEEQNQALIDPPRPEIRVVEKAERAATVAPRVGAIVPDTSTSESASPHQKDLPVPHSEIDRIPAEFDAKDATLDHMAKQLALRLRSAKPDQQAQLLRELEILNEQHFEYRQQKRKQELDRLSVRIDALRVLQLRRQENKAEVLKRRLKDLTDPNADLNWDEVRPADGSVSGQMTDVAGNIVSDHPADPDWIADPILRERKRLASTASPPGVEKTFDGTSYSQWLKMLETERKPEKLATAIDACSRLAEPADERRIIRGILIAASLFETGDSRDRDKVWEAGWAGLNRLPPPAVVDELTAVLRDEASYKNGRQFQVEFLAIKTSPMLSDALTVQAETLIGELVRLSSNATKDREYCLAAASAIWRSSNRPLDDFQQLKPALLKMMDEGPATEISSSAFSPWSLVATNLINLAPTTPDLALILVKHAKHKTVIELIGKMGRHAEPAVPALVDLFLENSNDWERQKREGDVRSRNGVGRGQYPRADQWDPRNLPIVQTLGEIGAGAKGYALLRQLALVLDFPRGRFDGYLNQWVVAVENSLLKFEEVPSPSTPFVLLPDPILINGGWNLRSIAPSNFREGTVAIFNASQIRMIAGRNYTAITSLIGGNPVDTSRLPRFELDDSRTPKQISVFRVPSKNVTPGGEIQEIPKTRHFGIYELTETTLRIQFSPLGEPCATELVADKSKLPEGQFLLEFDRKLDERFEKVNDPK